jgi:hypothetical protein
MSGFWIDFDFRIEKLDFVLAAVSALSQSATYEVFPMVANDQIRIRIFCERAQELRTIQMVLSEHVDGSARIGSTADDPPPIAEFLIALFARGKDRGALLGDLQEKFMLAIKRGWSKPRAQRMYWAETLRAIGPLAVLKLKQLGVIALVLSAAKKFFG